MSYESWKARGGNEAEEFAKDDRQRDRAAGQIPAATWFSDCLKGNSTISALKLGDVVCVQIRGEYRAAYADLTGKQVDSLIRQLTAARVDL